MEISLYAHIICWKLLPILICSLNFKAVRGGRSPFCDASSFGMRRIHAETNIGLEKMAWSYHQQNSFLRLLRYLPTESNRGCPFWRTYLGVFFSLFVAILSLPHYYTHELAIYTEKCRIKVGFRIEKEKKKEQHRP